jgi:RNA polymerase sigma factor (sigma-70 family)
LSTPAWTLAEGFPFPGSMPREGLVHWARTEEEAAGFGDATAHDDEGRVDDVVAPRSGAAAVVADDAMLSALIQRVVERDQRALEALYDATAARVHGLVLRITQQGALAEEVVEDTYWQVWRQAPRFDAARGRPLTWLLAMARSRAIDALRRDRRFHHDDLPEDGQRLAEQVAAPPQDLLDASRGADALHAALVALEPRARQLVALAFFRGLTHEEIAEQQRMPLGSVKSSIRRSLQQLRRTLAFAGT